MMMKITRPSTSSIPVKRLNKTSIKTSDIRYNIAPQSQPAFVRGNTFCTGTTDDIYLQRLTSYSKVISDYKDYFVRLMSAEMDLAHVYARIGDVLTINYAFSEAGSGARTAVGTSVGIETEASLLLPKENPQGLHSAVATSKFCQQNQVELHINLSNYIKTVILPQINDIEARNKQCIAAYKVRTGSITGQLTSCDLILEKNIKSLHNTCIGNNSDILTRPVQIDPFFQVIEITRLMSKKKSIMDKLHSTATEQLEVAQKYEVATAEALKAVISDYYQYKINSLKTQINFFSSGLHQISNVNGQNEYNHFITQFQDIIKSNSLTMCEQQNSSDGKYSMPVEAQTIIQNQIATQFKNLDWKTGHSQSHPHSQTPSLAYLKTRFRITKQGAIAIQERQRLFKKSYHRANMILTSAGYLHIYIQKTSTPISTFTSISPNTTTNKENSKNHNGASSENTSPSTTTTSSANSGSNEKYYHNNRNVNGHTSGQDHRNNKALFVSTSTWISTNTKVSPNQSPTATNSPTNISSNKEKNIKPTLPPKSSKSLMLETEPIPTQANFYTFLHNKTSPNVNIDSTPHHDHNGKDEYSKNITNLDTKSRSNENRILNTGHSLDIDFDFGMEFNHDRNQYRNQSLNMAYGSNKLNHITLNTNYDHDLNLDSSYVAAANKRPTHGSGTGADMGADVGVNIGASVSMGTDPTLDPSLYYDPLLKSSRTSPHSMDTVHNNSNSNSNSSTQVQAQRQKPNYGQHHAYVSRGNSKLSTNPELLESELAIYGPEISNPDFSFFIPQSRYRIVGSSLLSIQSKTSRAVLFDSEADIASWYASIQSLETKLMYKL